MFVQAVVTAESRVAAPFDPLNFRNTLDVAGLQAWLDGLNFKGRAVAGMKKYVQRLREIQESLDRNKEFGWENYDNIIAALSWWKQADIDLINEKLAKKSGQTDLLQLGIGTYHNSGLTFNSFKRKANEIEKHLKTFSGFHKKALKGGVVVRFVMKEQNRAKATYKTELDEMWVRANVAPKGDSYASLLYIITHELGHRYEKLYRVGTKFDSPDWYTTRYSQANSWSGEQFAELFALTFSPKFRSRMPLGTGVTQERFDRTLDKFLNEMR